MSDEPTVEGSIVAKLRVDKDQASADLAEYEAQVKALPNSVDTRVNVETGEATAQLAELEAAEAQLNVETDSSIVAFEKYSPALQQVGKSADSAAIAERNAGGYLQTVLAVVTALLPLMGPLAAEGVAVGASFIGMGASGILALEGIKKEMADGTTESQQYSAGIRQIKSDLGDLENVAADHLLGSFGQVVDEADEHLPQLSQDVAMLTDSLGHAGGSVIGAFLNGLSVMTPLVDEADKGIEKLASDFDGWSSGSGLIRFVNYAIAEVPIAEQNIGNLGSGVVDVVADLAPLGNIMLGILGSAGKVLSFFASLGPVLPVVAGGALGAYGAFKLWSTVPTILTAVQGGLTAVRDAGVALTPMTAAEIEQSALLTEMLSTEAGVLDAVTASEGDAAVGATAFGAAIDFATGPAGILIAIAGALAVAVGAAASATDDNTAAVSEYTAAVEKDNGVVGESVRLAAIKAIADAGVYTAAQKVGLSYTTVTNAALGNAAAQKKVTDALQSVAEKNGLVTDTTGKYSIEQAQLEGKSVDLVNTLNKIQNGVDGNNKSIDTAITEHQQIQTVIGATGAKQTELGYSTDSATAALQRQNNAATILTNTFTLLNGGTLAVAQAQTGLAAANNAVTDSFDQNGVAIDGSTKAAVANQQSIEAQVTAAQQYAEAIGTQTGSSEQAAAAYAKQKNAIEDELKSQGKLTPAVQAYIDKLYDLADLKIAPTKIDLDTSEALRKLQVYLGELQKLPAGSLVTINSRNSNLSGQAQGRAGGGFLDTGSGFVAGPGTTTSDSVLTRLSNKEFVVKASSAQQYPDFLRAYNDNPTKALGAVAGGQSSSGHSFTIVEAANANETASKVINRLNAVGAV